MRPILLVSFALSTAAIFAASPPYAQDATSAKSFLVSVYQHYQHRAKGIDLDGPHAGLYFHSSLLALMRADDKANSGEVGVLDGDPVCGCQDWDGIWDLKIEVQLKNRGRAEALVSFALFGPKDRTSDSLRKLKITLVPERGSWRIYDIVDESKPDAPFDLRNELQRDIDSLRSAPKAGAPH